MATFQRVIGPKVTLVDLLDRVLDRGLVIDADIIISLAGVPLIGVKLRAALASVETMVQYGLMKEWLDGKVCPAGLGEFEARVKGGETDSGRRTLWV